MGVVWDRAIWDSAVNILYINSWNETNSKGFLMRLWAVVNPFSRAVMWGRRAGRGVRWVLTWGRRAVHRCGGAGRTPHNQYGPRPWADPHTAPPRPPHHQPPPRPCQRRGGQTRAAAAPPRAQSFMLFVFVVRLLYGLLETAPGLARSTYSNAPHPRRC